MRIKSSIPTHTLHAASTLLAPYVPDITPDSFQRAIAEYDGSAPALNATRGITIQQTHDRLQASERTIWNMIKRGELRTYKVGRRRRVLLEDVERIEAGVAVSG